MPKKTVAVIMGGRSAEREVSLASGKNIAQALRKRDFDVAEVEIKEDGHWASLGAQDRVVLEPGRFVAAGKKIDVGFIALHGPLGEDGTIQGLFEMVGVPYTGSGVLASALAMNKLLTKRIFLQAKIPTPKFVAVDREKWNREVLHAVIAELDFPLVAKPVEQGSSIGVSIVKDEENLSEALAQAFSYGRMALVEEYIEGREIQCGVLGNQQPQALPLVEIVPKKEFFDYEAKYDPTLAEEIVPAPIDETKTKEIQKLSLEAFEIFGCRGFGRVDNFLKSSGEILVSEINTIPGLTEASLFPKEAQAAGITFPELVAKLVELALEK